MKVLQIRVPDQLRDALDYEAARVGLAPSSYARHVLIENLLGNRPDTARGRAHNTTPQSATEVRDVVGD